MSGKVSDERYEKMAAKYEAEQAELIVLHDTLEKEIAQAEEQAVSVEKFIAVVRRYTEIEKLTQAIVHEFIDKIIVHEAVNPRKDRHQEVEIIYNNIGAFDLENAQDINA